MAQKDPLDIIRREIAIMKKLQHRHVLKLIEVLNNDETDAFYMGARAAAGLRVAMSNASDLCLQCSSSPPTASS